MPCERITHGYFDNNEGTLHVRFDSEDEDEDDTAARLQCDDFLPPGADGPSFKAIVRNLQEAVRTEGVSKVKKILHQEFRADLLEQGRG